MAKLSKIQNGDRNAVKESMFGGNYTFQNDFDRNNPDGNSMPQEHLQGAGELLGGIETWRYPGGAVAEQHFDIFNWNSAISKDGVESITPMDMFFQTVGPGGKVAVVIPTVPALLPGDYGSRLVDQDYVAQVSVFVHAALELADDLGVRITAFEIGNEFWGHEMSGHEYGSVAAEMAIAVQTAQDAFDAANGPATEGQASILVQSTVVNSNVDGNPLNAYQEMLALTDAYLSISGAAEAMDGVVDHFYAKSFDIDEGAQSFFFRQMQSWESRAGKNLDWHVTEWNYHNGSSADETTELRGLKQATLMVEMMYRMVAEGVDVAQVWPVWSSKLTSTSLVHSRTTKDDPSDHVLHLKHGGAAFLMMNESIVDLKVSGHGNLSSEDGALIEYHSYSNDEDRDVIFLSNQSSVEVSGTYDFSDFVASYGNSFFVDALVLSDDVSASAGYDAMARSEVVTHGQSWTGSELVSGTLELTLSDWELTRITITDITEGKDHIDGGLGDDMINSLGGDDVVSGQDGNDTINSGEGADFVSGNDGNDRLSGNQGQDTLEGGNGDDSIWGGPSSDLLFGGNDADLLRGQAGDDEILGGSGNDTLEGGAGDDLLVGGPGSDTFVFNAGSGSDTISGFEFNSDKIVVDGIEVRLEESEVLRSPDGAGSITLELSGGGTVLMIDLSLSDDGSSVEPLIALPASYLEDLL